MVGYITNSMEMNLSKLWKIVEEEEPGVLLFMGLQTVGHDWVTELTDGFSSSHVWM